MVRLIHMPEPPIRDGEAFEPDVHEPVLVRELLALLAQAWGEDLAGLYVDATLGAGGHASRLLERFPGLRCLGLDHDEDSLAEAAQRLARFGGRVRTQRARLSELDRVLAEEAHVVLVLLDLGVCSLHLDRPERGFSFSADGPLDMRMDRRRETTAAQIVNVWDEKALADLLFTEGGERRSRRIARAICEARKRAPFLRTGALADLIERTVGGGGPIHPATKTFQALRREVNEEGEELSAALEACEQHLPHDALLCVISFHSGEDGEVKRFMQAGRRAGRFELLTKKPLGPERDEVRANPRARSARLRAARRVRDEGASA